ncbi:MAG: GNAT family N-acetyltransferase [Steroidobacteraceae bacterium]
MTLRIARSLAEVDAAQWNALSPDGSPFLSHQFLHALERSGCATRETGWEPLHLLLHDATGQLTGAMPLYLKSHSWGEFVLDFAWAEAHHRAGLRYYPRLVSAVPFTPATGPRLLTRHAATRAALITGARDLMRERGVSSLHVLFPGRPDREPLTAAGLMPRIDIQYHWHNEGYASFEDFLGGLTAEKRKKLRRERRRVVEAGIHCRTLRGRELDQPTLDAIYRLHTETFARYGNAPYLNREFFGLLAQDLPDAMVVELALRDDEPVACAVMLQGGNTLYGRYWGANTDVHSLHFELCFYRGIEYCIREGLQRFEPGTQGEHKLLRGFVPSPVWSMHDIADPRFAAAIGSWLARERGARRLWLREAVRHLPFRRADIPARLPVDVRDCLAEED